MLTTLRSTDRHHFFIDITVSEDGSSSRTLGPFIGEELARRWERYILIRHRTWEEIIGWDTHDNVGREIMLDMSLEWIVTETDAVTTTDFHEQWMSEHPLIPAQRRKVVCGWCNRVLMDGISPASHGICKRCSDIFI